MPIPLLDLKAQFETIRDDVVPAILDVVESQRFIMGELVERLECAIAGLAGASCGIACASGTDALLLSLKALRLEPGDEVITTPFTFFATAGAICNAGGRPVFVDIDPDTFNIDVDQAAAAVSSRTRAIVPVHLFGQMARMESLTALAEQHDLAIVEDAAQAIGARRQIDGRWRSAGGLGTTGAFSFFPSKNLGCWGDGGMIVTSDRELAARLRKLRTHGGAKQYHHEEVGINSRLDAIQAAVLLTKVPHLGAWADARRANAARYAQCWEDVDTVRCPLTDPGNEHVYHQYTIRAERRDELKTFLSERGIGSAVYYPRALHMQPCFADLGYREGQFEASERACDEVLSLPIYPELSEQQLDEAVAVVKEFYR
ncbi:MAG: DegT/DnrJ/EryC1/StrS family aminotransferase [Gemmatimonadales bacterium]